MRRPRDNGPLVGGRERRLEGGAAGRVRSGRPRGTRPSGRGRSSFSARPGGRAVVSSRVSGFSAPRVPPRLPGACPGAQGDPPSSWPRSLSRALCLHPPDPAGSVPCPGAAPFSSFSGRRARPRLPARDTPSCSCRPTCSICSSLGGARTPVPGGQRVPSGARRAPVPRPRSARASLALPHVRCSPRRGLEAGLRSRTRGAGSIAELSAGRLVLDLKPPVSWLWSSGLGVV